MTLATMQKWDTYIDRDLELGLNEIDREGQLKMLRQHIEAILDFSWQMYLMAATYCNSSEKR